MKKTYFAPKANAISLQTEDSILAGSGTPKAFDEVSNNEQLSNEKGWNSSDWSDAEE